MYDAKAYGLDVRGTIAENTGNVTTRAGRAAREWMATIQDLFYCMTRKEIPQ